MRLCRSKILATAAVFAGAVAFIASPAWAVHDTNFYEMDDFGVGLGADTDDPNTGAAFDADGVALDDADTVFHEECNAGTVVVPGNNPLSIYNDGEDCGTGAGGNGFRGFDLGKDAMTGAFEQVFIDDAFEPDETHHQPSNKDEAPIGGVAGSQASAVSTDPWGCVSKPNVNNKNDLLQGFVAFYEQVGADGDLADGDLVLFAGAARDSNNGNENFGVWLLKDPDVFCDSSASLFEGVHRDGDILIVAEFTNGGTAADVKAFKWNDPTPLAPESGDETLDPISGAQGGTFCSDQNDPSNTHTMPPNISQVLCGEVNNVSIFPAWEPEVFGAGPQPNKPDIGELPDNQWAEIAANITELLGVGDSECFAKVLIETRTSQSLSANLFDYMLADVNICGTLTIRKKTVGGVGTFDFESFSSQVPEDSGGSGIPDSSGDFSLTTVTANVPVGVTFLEIFEDDYTIREPVPSGWRLIDVSCTGDDDSGSVFPTVPVAAGSNGDLVVDLDRGETIVCTFTNEALAELKVTKVVTNLCDTDTGLFTLKIDGTTEAGPGGDGTDTGFVELATGDHTIAEVVSVLTAGDYATTISTTGGNSSGDCTDETVNLSPGEQVTCTYTNVRKATLTIVKELDPSGDSQTFDLLVGGVLATGTAGTPLDSIATMISGEGDNIGNGGTVTVRIDTTLSGGTFGGVSVGEIFADGTTAVTGFQTFITCDDFVGPASSATASVSITSFLPGEEVTCRIINIRPEAGLCTPPS